jgi:heme exporter protein D
MLHLETGKYAFFVWTAYGLTAVVFIALIASSLAHARRWRARAESLGRK